MALRDHKASTPIVEVESPEATIRPSDAARAALAELENGGRLTATDVVEAARIETSPLHRYFEWDDDAAAEAYRIEQARRLIRSVKVIVTEDSTTLASPRYVRDARLEDEHEQGYVTTEQLQREPENAQRLLRYEFGRAAAHCERACSIADALGMGDDTRKVVASIQRLLNKLS